MNKKVNNKKEVSKPELYTLLSTVFSGNVIVEHAPISKRMWNKGYEATIRNGQIRLSGCWFNFDNRYLVRACA